MNSFLVPLVPKDPTTSELGVSLSKHIASAPHLGVSVATLGSKSDDLLVEVEAGCFYMSCEASTIQPAKKYLNDKPCSLLILLFTFHPENSVARKVDHYMVIKGSSHGNPKTRCVWMMEENEDSEAGLPLNFQTAFILNSTLPVKLEVAVDATVGRKLKVVSEQTDTKVINLGAEKGRKFEVDDNLDKLKISSWPSLIPRS